MPMATPRVSLRVAWLVLPLLALVLFSRPIWRGEVLVPGDIAAVVDDLHASSTPAHNPLLSDVLYQFYPWQSFLFDRLHAGELPLWNPYQLAGTPFLANHQSAIFDPVRLLTFVAGFSAAGSFLPMAILRLGLFGLLIALWLRQRGFSLGVAILLGATAMVATPYVAWISYPLFASFLWLPLMLLGIDQIQKNRRMGLLLIAIGTAGQVFGGNIQMSLFLTLFSIAYAASMYWERKKMWTWVASGLVIGGLLSAIQLFPTLAFIKQSQAFETGRSGYANTNVLTAIQTGKWIGWHSLGDVRKEVKRLLPIIQPEVFGNPASQSYRFPDQTAQNNFNELAGSVGLGALWLAVVGMGLAWRERLVKFLTVSVGVMIGMIAHAPVFELLNYLPLIQQTSTGRLRFFVAFGLIALAGFGIRVLQTKTRKSKIWFWTVGAVLTICSLGLTQIEPKVAQLGTLATLVLTVIALGSFFLFKIWERLQFVILGICLIVPGFVLMRGYNTSVKVDSLLHKHQIIDIVQTSSNDRIVGISKNDRRVPLVPNSAMLFGLRDVRGYEVVRLNRYEALTQDIFIRSGSYLRAVDHPSAILNILGVNHALLADSEASTHGFLAAAWVRRDNVGGISWLENPNAFLRAFFIDHPRVVATAAEALQTVQTDVHIPIDSVIELGKNQSDHQTRNVGSAKVVSESANEVEVSVQAPSNGFVILNDAYDSGWKAFVDGREKMIVPANYAFRAVPVSAGSHQIMFHYQPLLFVVGVWVSISSGAIMLVYLMSRTLRRR